jgi:transcriptional regulator with XRE-family HTH domain
MGEIERGEVNVTATSLQQIGAALQMPLSTLLKGI